MRSLEPRRVVVTGVGVLSGSAIGKDAFWKALLADGEPLVPTVVEGFDAKDWMPYKQARRSDAFSHLAVAATRLALEDAGDVPLDQERTGVVFGTGIAGGAGICRDHTTWMETHEVGVLSGMRTMSNAAAANVSFALGIGGPCESISSGCASGTHAVGEGARMVHHGACDVAIVGGSEGVYLTDPNPDGFAVSTLKSFWVHTGDPVMRPFDAERTGFLLADGGAALVLEPLEAARARGATIYGEVVGFANTIDLNDLVTPDPTGAGASRCMQAALHDADRTPADVRLVNTHGSATVANDLAEARAIRALCGAPGPAVHSIKGVTGHTGAAAGAIEAVAVALCFANETIPHTAGLRTPDPEMDVDLVIGEPRPWEPGLALSLSMGLGGHTGCLAFEPVAADG